METIATRIHRVIQDLKAIQNELTAPSGKISADQRRLLDEVAAKDLLHEFKASVDHMRQLLWSYIEALHQERGENIDHTAQALRIQRVTEMLQVLRPNMQQPAVAATPEAQNLFELLEQISHSTVDRHLGGSRPV